MNLYIDTEFNGYQGELISMALVDENGREWYQSLGCENPSDWVAKNVMPVIGIEPISKEDAQKSLEEFLSEYIYNIELIADWPEDIAHFCNFLITGPGERIDTPFMTMQVRRDLDCSMSAVPHNALEDARAIWRMAMEKTTKVAV